MERLYIIADENLSIGYQAVQSGHAVAQFLIDNPNQTWNNQFLIFLSGDLNKTKYFLDEKGIPYTIFKEPDLNDQITALACINDGSDFKNLKLLN